MRAAIPPMSEPVDDLTHRLPRAHHGQKTPRLPMRYLLARGPVRTRQDVAPLLGVHRNTLGRWLAIDAAGGLEALLAPYTPAGHPVSLAPVVLASLAQARPRADGFASSEALRQWVRQTPGVEGTDKTLDSLVRVRFHAKRKGARPRHTKQA